MKSSKLAVIMGAVGVGYLFLSVWWFYLKFPDIDKLISSIIIGIAFVGVWFNYNSRVIHNNYHHEKIDQKIEYIDNLMDEIMADIQKINNRRIKNGRNTR